MTSKIAFTDAPRPNARVYRRPRSALFVGVAGLVVFLALAGAGIALPFLNPDSSVEFFRHTLSDGVQHQYQRFEVANIPSSQACRARQDRQARWSIALLPIAILAAAALACWNPWQGWARAGLGGPIAMIIVMSVRAVVAQRHARKGAPA